MSETTVTTDRLAAIKAGLARRRTAEPIDPGADVVAAAMREVGRANDADLAWAVKEIESRTRCIDVLVEKSQIDDAELERLTAARLDLVVPLERLTVERAKLLALTTQQDRLIRSLGNRGFDREAAQRAVDEARAALGWPA